MDLQKIKLNDKPLVDSFLRKEKRELAGYAFENVYIWSGIFDIYRAELNDSLLVFFEDPSGCFLYLSPLGGPLDKRTVLAAFEAMDERNGKSAHLSRIENIPEPQVPFYRGLGCECSQKPGDYICLKRSIADYKGEKFKHKRSAYNHFVKNTIFEYLPFSPGFADECLSLYDTWAAERGEKDKDRIYRSFLQDNRKALVSMLDSYNGLNITGRVIRIGGGIKAFTFGYELDRETFCVLFEITDNSVKGLSQYIFSRFASELPYTYLNIMDDSDLENLKEAKMSFHPEKLVNSYIAVRPSSAGSQGEIFG